MVELSLNFWKKELFFEERAFLYKLPEDPNVNYMLSLFSSLTTAFSSSLSTKYENLDGGNLSFAISLLLKEGHELYVDVCDANIYIRTNHCRIP